MLYLVNRQRVAIGTISISAITDQYLAEVARLERLDLDIASDFLLVASTLLEIKAASLLPKPAEETLEELEEYTPDQAREILIERLLLYKQYKNAAGALEQRLSDEGRMHARNYGPGPDFAGLLPDFLRQVSLDAFAYCGFEVFARKEQFLLESEHIAAKPLPVERQVRALHARIKMEGNLQFSQLIHCDTPTPVVVVSFLAILELYKRSMVRLRQDETFGDIAIEYIEDSGELLLDDEDTITSDDPKTVGLSAVEDGDIEIFAPSDKEVNLSVDSRAEANNPETKGD